MAAVASTVSNVDNVDLLIEGDDDNCVTVESAQLDLSTEEALLAPDPDDEDMEKKVVDVQVKDEKSAVTSTDSQPSTDITINRDVDAKEIPTPDEKLVKEEDKKNITQAVALIEDAKVDDDDDVIVLDDEEEESGASTSKRPRKDEDDDIMEVDESGVISKAERDSVGKIIRKMKRQDLEDLVLAKIVEGIVAHTEVGQLRGKVLELQMQKDKMASKMGIMMKQVAELSSAVNVILENEQRDPKNRIGKPHVIRFNRSVGLQTSIEPSVRTAPPTIIRVPEPIQNGVKPQGGANAGKGASNGVFQVPQPVKRGHQGNKAGDNKSSPAKQAIAAVPSPRKVYSSAATPPQAPPRLLPIVPKANTASQNAQPGIVDLTDDDPPPPATSTVLNVPATVAGSSVGSTATTFINGVQYQILNRSTTTSPNTSIQIVPAAGQKYLVGSGGQTRPVLLQQLGNNQPIMLRGVNNPPVTIVQQRQAAPRQGPNVGPRVAATIPVRGAPGSALGANSNAQKRFILPPLPATPPHKIRNDTQRPPAKPELTLNEQADGIVLSWNLPTILNYAEVTTYQIFACQECLANSNKPAQWKRVGDVKALPLPMACTLSQFTEENRYYFIVRGIDLYGRVGPFCDPQNILLRLRK